MSSVVGEAVTLGHVGVTRAITEKPTPITIVSAATSTRVSTTLNFTLSPTPRRLIRASRTMNPIATSAGGRRVAAPPRRPSRCVQAAEEVLGERVRRRRGAGDAGAGDRERHHEREEVDAERLVRVEAAPAAWGYLVTSSRYDSAVIVATTNASRNGSHTMPPTCRPSARDGVDAGSEDVPDDEQQQEPRPQDPFQPPVPGPLTSWVSGAVAVMSLPSEEQVMQP